LQDIQDDLVSEQLMKNHSKNWWNKLVNQFKFFMVEYRPWSVLLIVFVVIVIAVLIAMVLSPGEDHEPEFTFIERTDHAGEEKQEEPAEAETEESKKEQ